ncbi:MAG: hypothetical protein HFF45_03580 [Lawsonibacter sp.]|nr:hypothetical protein [Lawsonibacter sp.]
METIIVEISVPAISKIFDFQLPSFGIVRDVTREIIYIVEQTESCAVFDEVNPMLCHVDDGRILNPGDTLAEAGAFDGNRLLLL